MKFVATKSTEQLDLQALHRVRERLVSQRTGIINQIRAFLLERGVAVRQGLRFLRAELPRILAAPCDSNRFAMTSPLMLVMPVMLPPGRARLATSPVATGSKVATNTTGIWPAASRAGNTDGVPEARRM